MMIFNSYVKFPGGGYWTRTIYSSLAYDKWWFSTVVINYQRVHHFQTIHGSILVKTDLNIVNGKCWCLGKDKRYIYTFVTGYTRPTLCQYAFIHNHPCIINGICDWFLHDCWICCMWYSYCTRLYFEISRRWSSEVPRSAIIRLNSELYGNYVVEIF